MNTNDAAGRPAVPDWMLERYALSELPAAEMTAVREALAADPALRERLAALRRDSADRLAAHPPVLVGAEVRRRLAGQRASSIRAERQRTGSWRPSLVLAAPALLAAVAVGFWLGRPPTPLALPSPAAGVSPAAGLSPAAGIPPAADVSPAAGVAPRDSSSAGPETTRIKGAGPRLLLFRSVGGVVETLPPGATAKAGDVVQLAYHASGARFGAIVSVDGRGVVTSHVPRTGTFAAPLASGGPVTLETAYRLDDAPQFEAFYFVTSAQPFELAEVRAAALLAASEGTAPPDSLPLPASFDQAAFLLRKDVPR